MRGPEIGCFKAYDIRGRLGETLDDAVARAIGQGFAEALGARLVVVGQDARASSPGLARALAEGLMAQGVEVVELGLCGTEEVYFATAHLGADGGVCVTASHNPADENGMKMVKAGAAPLSRAEFAAVKARAEAARAGGLAPAREPGHLRPAEGLRAAYVARVLSFVEAAALGPFHIVVNAGNGAAGPTFDAVLEGLEAAGAKLRVTRLHHAPDPAFPNGIPNPMLPENRPATADAVRAARADLGLAWDGDFDRCFFFDATGAFVDGEQVVALLAEAMLARAPGAAVVHDGRVTYAIRDAIAGAGGRAVLAPTGHAFMKQALRDSGAIYGGELSAHHYFRDFFACDSGMIPWLLVLERMSATGLSLAELVGARAARFPTSGEINFAVPDPAAAIAAVAEALAPAARRRDDSDGLALDFGDWRFSLRPSNTEALLRLNVEARGPRARVAEGRALVEGLIARA